MGDPLSKLRTESVELERRIQALQNQDAIAGSELKRATQHVRLANQYLELLINEDEDTAMIGMEVAAAAAERIADRQMQYAIEPSLYSNPLPEADPDGIRGVTVLPEDDSTSAGYDYSLREPANVRMDVDAAPAEASDATECPSAPEAACESDGAEESPQNVELVAPSFGDDVLMASDRQDLEGDNSTISISDLVSWFSLQGRDGVLRVSIPGECVTIVFEKGVLVHASSDHSPRGSRLGEILVAQGALTEADLEQFFSGDPKQRSKRFGAMLEEGQIISSDHLRKALQTQVKMLLRRTFEASRSRFALREGRLRDSGACLSLNVMELLLDDARVADEAGA